MLSDRLVCVSAHVRVRPAFLTSRVIVCTAPQGQNCKNIMRKLVNDKPTRQSFFEDRNVSTRTEKCYKKILKLHKKNIQSVLSHLIRFLPDKKIHIRSDF